MASSFADQIPVIIYLIQQLRPVTLLDVGKGLGKYGFLAHEYAGISLQDRPDPTKTVAQQSRLTLDAVEVEESFLWPHLSQFYRQVFVGKIEDLLPTIPTYDVVLLADVIEHMSKRAGMDVVDHFVRAGSKVVVSTPKDLFSQHLCGSEYEEHVSHWTPVDFAFVPAMTFQNVGAGRVFLLSNTPIKIRGFGSDPVTRLRRIARLLRGEFS